MIEYLQAELEAIYGVTATRVRDFLLGREQALAMGGSGEREELLVLEEGDEMFVGLFLDEDVLAATSASDPHDPRPRLTARRSLDRTACALEGVSHFVYLSNRAAAQRPVSLLELEVQAEIDKFALAALHLWRNGRRHEVPRLHERLFDEVGFLPHLRPEELERYRTANRLARGYCRELLRYVEQGRVEPLLAELRRAYRLGAGEKYSHLNRALH